MKKIKTILILAVVLLGSTSQAQTSSSDSMKLVLSKIVYKGVEISTKEAKSIAVSQSTEAYDYFKQARNVENWNLTWSIVGGFEIGSGLAGAIIDENNLWVFDLAAGAILVSLPYWNSRKNKRLRYIKMGVDAYNKSLN